MKAIVERISVLALSVVAAAIASAAASQMVAAAVALLVVVAVIALAIVARGHHGNEFLIFVFALTIPFNAQVTLLTIGTPDPIHPHAGGAPGFQLHGTLLVLLTIAACNLLSRRHDALRWRFDWQIGPAILVYLLVGTLTLAKARYPEYTWYELFRLVELFAAFTFVASLRRPEHTRILLIGIALGVILQTGVAAFQFATGHMVGLRVLGEDAVQVQNIGYSARRTNGTIGNPNQFGYYLEILLPVMFALWIKSGHRALRWLFLLALLGGTAALVTTLSRAAWATVPVTLGVLLPALLGRRLFELRGVLRAVGLAGVLAVAAILVFPTLEKRLTHDDYGSTAARTPLNLAAWSVINRHPLLGVGLNNLGEVFMSEDDSDHSRVFESPKSGIYTKQVVHNLYLLVWSETGIFGLVAFLGQFVAAAVLVARFRSHGSPGIKGLRLAILLGLMAQLIHGSFDPGFKTVYSVSLLVYVLLGLLVATTKIQSREARSRRASAALEHAQLPGRVLAGSLRRSNPSPSGSKPA